MPFLRASEAWQMMTGFLGSCNQRCWNAGECVKQNRKTPAASALRLTNMTKSTACPGAMCLLEFGRRISPSLKIKTSRHTSSLGVPVA